MTKSSTINWRTHKEYYFQLKKYVKVISDVHFHLRNNFSFEMVSKVLKFNKIHVDLYYNFDWFSTIVIFYLNKQDKCFSKLITIEINQCLNLKLSQQYLFYSWGCCCKHILFSYALVVISCLLCIRTLLL